MERLNMIPRGTSILLEPKSIRRRYQMNKIMQELEERKVIFVDNIRAIKGSDQNSQHLQEQHVI